MKKTQISKSTRWGKFQTGVEETKHLTSRKHLDTEIIDTRIFVSEIFRKYLRNTRTVSKKIIEEKVNF
jgi:hypothetical protein